jgi:glycogenin glucosyltransferase
MLQFIFRQELLGIWDRLIVVDLFDSEDSANLALLQRPDLGITFTKLHAWKLVEYEKCVFLDADTLVLQNVDDLFSRPEISAAPDTGWPDCFNSGVFVFVPSIQTHNALVAHALAVGSFDGKRNLIQ